MASNYQPVESGALEFAPVIRRAQRENAPLIPRVVRDVPPTVIEGRSNVASQKHRVKTTTDFAPEIANISPFRSLLF